MATRNQSNTVVVNGQSYTIEQIARLIEKANSNKQHVIQVTDDGLLKFEVFRRNKSNKNSPYLNGIAIGEAQLICRQMVVKHGYSVEQVAREEYDDKQGKKVTKYYYKVTGKGINLDAFVDECEQEIAKYDIIPRNQ